MADMRATRLTWVGSSVIFVIIGLALIALLAEIAPDWHTRVRVLVALVGAGVVTFAIDGLVSRAASRGAA
jgi:hypothetical protein